MAENMVGIEEPQAFNGVTPDFISLLEVFFPPTFKQGTGRKRLGGTCIGDRKSWLDVMI
jgi:hypothetical protein